MYPCACADLYSKHLLQKPPPPFHTRRVTSPWPKPRFTINDACPGPSACSRVRDGRSGNERVAGGSRSAHQRRVARCTQQEAAHGKHPRATLDREGPRSKAAKTVHPTCMTHPQSSTRQCAPTTHPRRRTRWWTTRHSTPTDQCQPQSAQWWGTRHSTPNDHSHTALNPTALGHALASSRALSALSSLQPLATTTPRRLNARKQQPIACAAAPQRCHCSSTALPLLLLHGQSVPSHTRQTATEKVRSGRL